jgi:hypothetical protein
MGCWRQQHCWQSLAQLDTHAMSLTYAPWLQVTKYVEREIINHCCLVHPHIVQFKEVRHLTAAADKPH